MRNERIPGMRSDSFEWICSKLRVRTYQGLAETFGFPVGRKSLKKREKMMSRVNCKRKNDSWANKNKFRTGHVVVVATSLVGRHDSRQSDLAEVLAVAAASPIDQ
jgi:hypothetical protein